MKTQGRTQSARSGRWAIVIPAGILAGALMTAQAQVNSALTGNTSNAVLSACISFSGGVLILGVLLLASRSARSRFVHAFSVVRAGGFPWWLTLGGSAGALYVFSQGEAVSVVGIALFTVAYVAALMFGSFLWDHLGIGPSGSHPFSFVRLTGALLAVCAVVVTVVGSHELGSSSWLVALPVAAGIASSWQQVANGRVQTVTQHVIATTFWNFLVGWTVLTIATIVRASIAPTPWPHSIEWWMLLGGPIGVIFIGIQAQFVRYAGALVMTTLVTFGQLGASLLSEQFGASSASVSASTYIGVGIAAAAVGVTLLANRRQRSTEFVLE